LARATGAVAVIVLTAVVGLGAQTPPSDVASSTFRVFLKDGRALPAYGESAVVADRVVFSLIVGGGAVPMALQLVNLPASSVDLERTARYAKAVRAAYFAATTGEAEYQAMTSDIASTLNALPAIADPALRLQLAEEARERLATWSADHYDYHAADVQQVLAQFDGVIGQLRGGTGAARIAMDLVAGATEATHEAVLPPPTLRESIEAALLTVAVADDIATREAILRTVVDTLGSGAVEPDLAADARRRLDDELGADRAYESLTTELLARANTARRRGDVAALIIEPIQGKGVHMPPDGFLTAAADLLHSHGALLICDEVQSGFGRTGRFFAYQHEEVVPDIVTVAKALSGGFVPVGAMLAKGWIFEKVFSSMDRVMVHSTTFKGGVLAMTAGLASLAVLDDEGLVENAARTGEAFRAGLVALAQRYEVLADVRGRGLMIGLEFDKPSSLRARTSWNMLQKARVGLFAQMVVVALFQRHRILTQVSGDHMEVIKLIPPLMIGDTEVKLFNDAFAEVLEDASRARGLIWDFGRTLVKQAVRN